MKRVLQASATILLPIGLAFAAPSAAQELLQPVLPQGAQQPAPVGNSVGPRLNQPQPAAPATVPAAPDARPLPAPIRDSGPANEKAAPAVRKATTPTATSARVLDASGVPLTGYIQVAPNRVYDPSTNRYHWTVRSGEQQKIVE